jgi:hypothetical protein
MDINAFKETICNIETEVCHLHQLAQEEELTVSKIEKGQKPSINRSDEIAFLEELRDRFYNFVIHDNVKLEFKRSVNYRIAQLRAEAGEMKK